MTRKLFGAALAMALAGGVYLAGAPAQASNMGFKLEREFAPVNGFKNEFFVSFPLFNGLGDVANTTDPAGNKCVGDTGGPAAGDGVINGDDVICDLWTSRQGTFTVARYDISSCSFQVRFATIDPFTGNPGFSGTWVDPLPRDEAFRVSVQFVPSVTNSAVIVGSHDPSYTGRSLRPNASCQAFRQGAFLNLPYHTMYKNAVEILCGLEGTDWMRDPGTGNLVWLTDNNGDTTPDPCPNGIYAGKTITVSWFDNVDDNSGPAGIDTDNQNIACAVQPDPFGGGVLFPFGTDCYDLIPGEGYVVLMSNDHPGSTFLSPHF